MAIYNYNESYGVARVLTNSIIIYGMNAERPPRTQNQIKAEINLSRGDKNGYLSHKTKLSITKILRCWIMGVDKFRDLKKRDYLQKLPYFTFVTLTLSAEQNHTDLQIKRKLVFPFIQKLQRKHNVWQYFYVCEKQENGNLHIHLLIDSFVQHEIIRTLWNETQALHGYLDAFETLHGHRNPNSTDIHKLKGKRSVEAYLVKYMVKDKKNMPIKGRLWGCSDGIRKLKPYNEILSGTFETVIREIESNPQFKVKKEENYTLITGNVMNYLKHYHKDTHDIINRYYAEQAANLYRIHPDILAEIKKRGKEEEKLIIPVISPLMPKWKIIPQLECPF